MMTLAKKEEDMTEDMTYEKEKEIIATIRIQRSQDGIHLQVQSPILEPYIQKTPPSILEDYFGGTGEDDDLYTEYIPDAPKGYAFPNLAIFRRSGLEKGIETHYPLILPDHAIRTWLAAAERAVLRFYTECVPTAEYVHSVVK
jgi:hypothetical protein